MLILKNIPRRHDDPHGHRMPGALALSLSVDYWGVILFRPRPFILKVKAVDGDLSERSTDNCITVYFYLFISKISHVVLFDIHICTRNDQS